MQRRDFFKLPLVPALLAGCDRGRGKIGLALGGGGARGLAHIPMLEVFDELGLRPHRIAGTSIGAIIGMLYAAGMAGHEIRALVDRLTLSRDESWLEELFRQDSQRWWDLLDLKIGGGGLVDSRPFVDFLEKTAGVSDFDQLAIPLRIVATDFWSRDQVVFSSGRLGPAVQASMAIPGLFDPVRHAGRVLVDGGLANPVPYDLLFDDCDFVVAIDVIGNRKPDGDGGPGYFETLFNTMQIMQANILREKLARRAPQVYIRPDLEDIRVLEFNRADEIYAQSMPARLRLQRELS